ncbi:PREDICTED: LOW QUALITY PROTEIN: wall-associated receptor kinase-like 18 [Brassica oleracea var. oleracea]|uniref:LOW QUALITY PROTEIN: wall-associated receptor kinase-like 18 n=1 Tax=Brassica oleracea var. oleracea TaxID=109376 RepID=UPI0006A757E2|nr:PREDICTED: LOW QUALITY PROTEIN: wall-associated receptor kinase-like 18 [Brassica oleracea var. oleracea]
MIYENTSCIIFLKFLLLLILYFAGLVSSCESHCGDVEILYPFGIGKGCYLEKSYEIQCRNTTSSGRQIPFLSAIGKEVVYISLPTEETFLSSQSSDIVHYLTYGLVRVKTPIISAGCLAGGEEFIESIMNFTGTPFFIDDTNSLIAVVCNAKVSLTHIKPNMVGCELICNTSEDQPSNNIPFLDKAGCSSKKLSYRSYEGCTVNRPEEAECDGNGCCQVSLPNDPQQAIGIRIESNDGNSTTRTREEHCRVAFITDEVYTLYNATKPRQLFGKKYATFTLRWVIQTKNHSFLSSLRCANIKDNGHTSNSIGPQLKCLCDQSNISEITYVHCGCKKGFTGNAYIRDGCQDVNECQTLSYPPCRKGETCVNTQGDYDCVGDKKKPILIGVGSGFGVLVLVGGVWWLRKFLIKRRVTKRKKKFFKRNGGLLLQQELNTKEGNVEKTRIFSLRELEKATENFSQNRVLGHGGQGTVYKGMLLDGRTVAVKKSKVIDEDKLQEFINEVVILSQINHRHIVKLLGCCLETEVPMLVYEFIINGNLFQHIQEESDDYTMVWGMRLRIAVDVAGALSYLHSSASSPIYHRDIKSSNILLDEKYRAKVADFGTSRSVTIDQTHWTTVVSGTVGYVDPEYYRSSQYTEKSDVYSFGAILAELITGDKPVIMVQNTREIVSLADHFRIAMKENRLSNIMDARIKDDCKPEQVMAVANLALKCLSWKGKKRPNMRQVFMELERICTSPEGLQEQNRNDEESQEEEEEEEEDVNMINKECTSWSVSVTAPAVCTVASPSSSDVEPLFPRLTWCDSYQVRVMVNKFDNLVKVS